MHLSLRLALVALLAAAPASAQGLTGSQAIAAVKAAGKQELKDFKAVAKTALAQLDADLDQLEDALDDSTDATALAASVAQAGLDLLEALDGALFFAVDGISSAEAGAVEDMAGLPDGVFPTSLCYGTSGALDDALTALRKAAAKVRDAAEKRFGKTIAKAEAKGGVGLGVTFQWPREFDWAAIDEDDTNIPTIGAELELLVSASALDTAGDGAVIVVGTSDEDATDVELQIFDSDGAQDNATAVFVDGGPFLFSATMNQGGDGLPEGNYVVALSQGTGPRRTTLPIGVR